MAEYDLLDNFDYELDDSGIAQTPVEPRDSAKMLTFSAGQIMHKQVKDLVDELVEGDVLVVNDTKVRPARFHLQKSSGGSVEVLLLKPTGKYLEWTALVKPSKRVAVGSVLEFNGQPILEVGEVVEEQRVVRLLDEGFIDSVGEIPLPPYIKQKLQNSDRYQTVYANRVGSAAAPTAGLHLSTRLLKELKNKGVDIQTVDLEVGLGTFKPIATKNVADHAIHTETYRVSQESWDKIRSAKRVIACGTTVVRTLETVAKTNNLEGSTALFIKRDFDWQVVDRLLTNFHVPKSSLLVLVDAFIGSAWKDIYLEAKLNDYRFLSLGDCMLLDRM